jgi:hypothetical protein
MKYVLVISFQVLLTGCAPPSPKPNQQQGALSPSGRYVVRVPIETNTTDPAISGTPVWKVTILYARGTVLYKDENSTFVGALNVYWLWDDSDRLWLYNSDDGTVHFWELTRDDWQKHRWGYGRKKEIEREISPPDSLYPGYVK